LPTLSVCSSSLSSAIHFIFISEPQFYRIYYKIYEHVEETKIAFIRIQQGKLFRAVSIYYAKEGTVVYNIWKMKKKTVH
jgi:hypothetical protein